MDCKFGEDEFFCTRNRIQYDINNAKLLYSEKILTENSCLLKYSSTGYLMTKINPPFNSLMFCKLEKCKFGELKCIKQNYCIKIDQVCDGIKHCMEGDDETLCGN